MKYLIAAFCSLVFSIQALHAQNSYRIQPGDTLAIEVLEDGDLNRTVLILPDGSFNFPFAGTVRAGGRTAEQIRAAVTAAISRNFASTPNVFVSVRSVRPVEEAPEAVAEGISVFFLGEIGNPGERRIPHGTTFLQAMSQAGALTRFAATKRVQLRRTNTATGQQTVKEINFKALTRGARLQRSIIMQDGDVVLIPERRLFE